jgi:hypothetical protein
VGVGDGVGGVGVGVVGGFDDPDPQARTAAKEATAANRSTGWDTARPARRTTKDNRRVTSPSEALDMATSDGRTGCRTPGFRASLAGAIIARGLTKRMRDSHR